MRKISLIKFYWFEILALNPNWDFKITKIPSICFSFYIKNIERWHCVNVTMWVVTYPWLRLGPKVNQPWVCRDPRWVKLCQKRRQILGNLWREVALTCPVQYFLWLIGIVPSGLWTWFITHTRTP